MNRLLRALLRGICVCGDWWPPGQKCPLCGSG